MNFLQGKFTYANVVSTLCLFLLVAGGTAFAASQLGKNSVGTKQLKNGSVTGQKIAAETITGNNLNLGALGTVPSAASAGNAAHASTSDTATNSGHATTADSASSAATSNVAKEAKTVNGFEVGCFEGTVFFHGECYDDSLNSPVAGVKAASSACSAKGGELPSPLELYNVRNVINLGTGVAPDYAVADQYYANTVGVNYRTLTVDGAGKIEEITVEMSTRYICKYSLLE